MHLLPTATRSITLTAVLLVGLVACGSDDDSGAQPEGTAGSSQDAAAADSGDEGDASDSASAGGSGTATLTMADGTAYVFEMTTCDTSNTDDFVISDSYDLSGATADGDFWFYLARAGLGEDFITQVGTLEGDFYGEGQNAKLFYNAQLGDEPLTVDGA